ncbi:MAG: hypothetical protein EOR67_28650 [Mesorhizobium sp.]|uniref:hypothetical protein n=1 Tax=Mesorhizobium sp. TaxID=1871066 RepID=UPI000FEA53F5|nr:hypothetical protein [Mesorhizobium sp.]RWL81905.1 MAG: hypothetical protein EOR67_28650 [Mesorhizobium sp.]RWL82279.1 MAG: hypothetical protein EOR69_16345 [Mesorhizobium sp.]RWL98656.1 MAG: hypothetical protein EOR70_12620 [Mesorhizobium sp.]
MCRWLQRKSDEIQAAAAILGVVVGFIGFGATWWQLRSANNSLQASNTYTIQHDAREIAAEVLGRGLVQKLKQGTLSADERDKAKNDFWTMLNFYLSVFRQLKAGGINDNIGAAFGQDFCQLLSEKQLSDAFDEMLAEKKISQNYVIMRETWCAKN